MNFLRKNIVIISGLIVGFFGAYLVKLGNPSNMGVCVACFVRDIAGAVGLHRAGVVQYIRPEVIGFILGSFAISLAFREFKVKGGSSPLTRFVLGFFVMIGALAFLGCPFRMVLRIANGDLNAVIGLFGFIFGIYLGTIALKGGFTLGKTTEQNISGGFTMPIVAVFLLVLLLIKPDFIFFSLEGPGSFRAPIAISLAVGLLIGVIGQRSRLCMAGGIRDVILIRDFYMLKGYIAVCAAALITNVALGFLTIETIGFEGHAVAHSDHLWNFLGLALVGVGSVLLGGCPLRQLILTGEGNLDAGITVLGMFMGGAFVHNFNLAGTPAVGLGFNGKIAVILGFLVMGVIVISHSKFILARLVVISQVERNKNSN